MSQSDQLSQFYQDMQAWIDAGCPENEVLSKHRSVCNNMISYIEALELTHVLYDELADQLKAKFQTYIFPFNAKSPYGIEQLRGTMYENPQRLKWIKDHA